MSYIIKDPVLMGEADKTQDNLKSHNAVKKNKASEKTEIVRPV
jgi:hypothetical protein